MEPDNTPQHSQGFGPAEDADATRQAQHTAANDVPVDVNPNAIVARTQAAGFIAQQETITQMGKNFEHVAARRNSIFDDIAAYRASKLQ
jgi:hypothetical protein